MRWLNLLITLYTLMNNFLNFIKYFWHRVQNDFGLIFSYPYVFIGFGNFKVNVNIVSCCQCRKVNIHSWPKLKKWFICQLTFDLTICREVYKDFSSTVESPLEVFWHGSLTTFTKLSSAKKILFKFIATNNQTN